MLSPAFARRFGFGTFLDEPISAPSDVYWDNVVSLLSLDGDNDSTSFPDEKGITWSAVGNAKLSTALAKFGTAALILDGNGDYLNSVNAESLDFGTGDFTVEGWVYVTGTGSVFMASAIQGTGDSGNGWALSPRDASFGNVVRYFDYNTNTGANGSTPVTLNEWHHVAASRKAGTVRVFLDGALEIQTGTYAGNYPAPSRARIGATPLQNTVVVSPACYIDEVRVTKGVARYTEAFTPSATPFPTQAPPPGTDEHYASVMTLLHFDGVDGSTTFTDQKGHTWSATGSVQLDTTESKFGGSSLLLDGSGAILAPDSDDWSFGTGDFTLEAWVKPSAFPYLPIFAQTPSMGSDKDRWHFDLTYDYMTFTVSAPNDIIVQAPSVGIVLGNWYHVAVTRSGNTFRLFLNGVQQGSDVVSSKAIDESGPLYIGFQRYSSGSRYFTGHIDEARITKGVARYVANFTPPTAAFPDVGA